jgi:hypothetical protein
MLRAEFATSRAREALEIAAATTTSSTTAASSKKQARGTSLTGFMPATQVPGAMNKRDGGGIGGRPRVNRRGSLKGGDDKPIFEGDDLEVDNAVRELVLMNFNEKSGSTIILESTMILMHQQKVGYILRPRGTRIIVDHSNRIALINRSIQSPCCITPSLYAVTTSEENQRGTFCRFVE